jgi:hypothetical protein
MRGEQAARVISGHWHKSEHSGGGALEVGDLRLLEDGDECRAPLFTM